MNYSPTDADIDEENWTALADIAFNAKLRNEIEMLLIGSDPPASLKAMVATADREETSQLGQGKARA